MDLRNVHKKAVSTLKKYGMDLLKDIGSELSIGFSMNRGRGEDQQEIILPKYLFDRKGIHMGHIAGSKKAIYFPSDDNRPKVVKGATRAGKTEAMIGYFVKKVSKGMGGCWIGNTDGKDIMKILRALPREDLARVVLLDHSDQRLPIGIGHVQATGDIFQNDTITDQWVDFFITNFGIDGQFMTQELISYACKAIFTQPNMTLLDVVNFVQNGAFRNWVLQRLDNWEHEDIINYWEEFERRSESDKRQIVSSFLRRANILLRSKFMKATFGQLPKSPLVYRQWMDTGKIVLINATEGLGKQAVRTIVSTHVLNFWHATLSREDTPQEERLPFLLAWDEPQTAIGNNAQLIDDILSKAGKYGLRFVILYQSDAQVKKYGGTNLLDVIYHNEPDLLEFHRQPTYHYTLTIDGYDPVLVAAPGVVKLHRDDVSGIVNAHHEQFNRGYKIVLDDIRRRLRQWGAGVDTNERRSVSRTNGLNPSSDPNSADTTTSKSSDSFFLTK